MSQALALIAHDLKNALGGLEAELEGLTQHPNAEGARLAQVHCAELRQQFVQFLTLYGAEDGTLRALCEDESPMDMLNTLCSQWARKFERVGSHLTIEVDPNEIPPFWHYDRRLVQLALDAAIHNASRFARQRITLGAHSEDGWLTWAVCDDGPGLGSPDAHAEHSTGLGTALARAVASCHQLQTRVGHLHMGPRPGGGTCFNLRLP